MLHRHDLDPYANSDNDTHGIQAGYSASSKDNSVSFFTMENPQENTKGQENDAQTVKLKKYPFKHHLLKPKPQPKTEQTPLLLEPEPVNLNVDFNEDDAEANNIPAANGQQLDNDICCCFQECCCELSMADYLYILLCTLGWSALGTGAGWVCGAGCNCCMSEPDTFFTQYGLEYFGISHCDSIWFTTQSSVTVGGRTLELCPEANIAFASVVGAFCTISAFVVSSVDSYQQPCMIRPQ